MSRAGHASKDRRARRVARAALRTAALAAALAASMPGAADAQATRPGSGDAPDAPTARRDRSGPAGLCADCGTVQSIERRERPRWSSIVGTAASYGVMPQRLGPQSAAASRRPADPASSEDAAAPRRDSPSGGATGDRAAAGSRGAATGGSAAGRDSAADGAAGEADADPDALAGRAPAAASNAPDDLPESRRRALRGDDDLPRRLGWQVVVRMDDGTVQTAYSDRQPDLRVGDRVRMPGTPARPR